MQLKVGEDVYPFDLDGLRNDEADAIERALGCSFSQFTDRVKGGWASATTAYVWIMRRRADPKVRLAEIRFTLRDLDMLYDDDEAREILAAQVDGEGEDGRTAADKRQLFLEQLPEDQRERVQTSAGSDSADPLDSTADEAAPTGTPNGTAT